MIRILAVDDERPIAELLRVSLTRAGYDCLCAYDGLEAANLIEKENFDLILLDIMLPGADGFELMDYIRTTGVPVIFLTAKNAVSDRVKGLKMGAEDYMVKPFDILELLARVENVLRRHGKLQTVIRVGNLEINTVSMQVLRDGQEVALTRKEYELALLFARNVGVVLPKNTRTVELHIQRMKKKVGWDDKIRPVYGMGYRLEG